MQRLLFPVVVSAAALAVLPGAAAAQSPTVTAVTPAPAELPGQILVQGQNLGGTFGVEIDGKPVAPVGWTPTTVTFTAPPGDPGFRDLTLTTIGFGQTFWPGALELWPSLTLDGGSPGDPLTGQLDLGGAAPYVIVASPLAPTGPSPFPGAYYGLELDSAGLAIVASGTAPATGEVDLSIPTLPLAGLVGNSASFQAWGLVPAAPAGGASFSNAVTVEFEEGMAILDCSLGCSGTIPFAACTDPVVAANGTIEVTFTEPVDPATVSPLTFKLSTPQGAIVPGSLAVDHADPRVVRFEPLLTLGPDGKVEFGLVDGETYLLRVPGTSSNVGPWIRSVDGDPNQTQLTCDLTVDGVDDPIPGLPAYQIFAETAAGDIALPSAQDVPLDARLRIEFDELMDISTLIDLPAGTSPNVTIKVDLDGDVFDPTDQLPLAGAFSLAVDLDAQTTTLWFEPVGGFPSAGAPGQQPRQILIEIPPTKVKDIAGNILTLIPIVIFTPEAAGGPLVLPAGGEDFDDLTAIDERRSGTLFDTATGRSLPGLGGGSGELGDLVVGAGQTVVLSTSADGSAVFGPGASFDTFVIDSYDTFGGVLPGQQSIVVSDGLFEFASLRVDAGGTLRLAGDAAARLFVRGDAIVEGRLSAAGEDAAAHPATALFGGEPGQPGAGGGRGGRGGDRNAPSGTLTTALLPGVEAHAPGAVVTFDGDAGEGRGGRPPSGADDFGAGPGGPAFGPQMPGPDVTDFGSFEANNLCMSAQIGVAGGGAGFATPGGQAQHQTPNPPLGVPTIPTIPQPSASLLRAFEVVLDPDSGGTLEAGAGGGGGGTGIAFSKSNGIPFNCQQPLIGSTKSFLTYADASASAGGSGGGGLQLQVGRRLVLDGDLDLSGGAGGDMLEFGEVQGGVMTAPGGGGTGGASLVQAFDIELGAGLIDVSGGPGGFNFANGSAGGDGGAGIVHVENSGYLAGTSLPPSIVPDVPLTGGDVADVLLPGTGGPSEPATDDLVLVGDFLPGLTGASARSGFQSCWAGGGAGVFELDFDADDPASGATGWNAQVDLVLPSGQPLATVDLRGDSGIFTALTGSSLEDFIGNDLGVSPLVIRFQGVRALGTLDLVCDGDAPFFIGSLTPWVRHPEELETYWDLVFPGQPAEAAKRRPNLIRYQIVFDRDALLGEFIGGVSGVQIGALGF